MSNKSSARNILPQARPIGLLELRMAALTASVSMCHANTTGMLRASDEILTWLTAPYQPHTATGEGDPKLCDCPPQLRDKTSDRICACCRLPKYSEYV